MGLVFTLLQPYLQGIKYLGEQNDSCSWLYALTSTAWLMSRRVFEHCFAFNWLIVVGLFAHASTNV